MASNSRLAIAVHSAGLLAFSDETPMTSETIAKSAGTSPVVVRRLLGALTKAGIVSVRKGTGGGARLTRGPESISLAEIYDALDEDGLFQVPELGPEHACPVGRAVRPVLEDYFGGAEEAMRDYLTAVSLGDVIAKVHGCLKANERGESISG